VSAVRLIGQGDDYRRLLRSARTLMLPHAVLLEGGAGTGKSAAVLEVACAILCPAPDADGACGVCATCRKVLAASHADMHAVRVPDEKEEIPVEQVRELQRVLGRSPVEGRARVATIDPADALNEHGQNALLKSLEEPGSDTFFVLATRRPESLLDTVRSRVARLRILPLDPATLRSALGGGDRPEIERALRLARGSMGMARRLVEPDALDVSSRVAEFLTAPRATATRGREFLQGVTDRNASTERARVVLAVLRALLWETRVAIGATAEYVDPLSERLTDALELVFAAEEDLGFHIGAGHVLDGLFLRLARTLQGHR
jgi:DNA polymerase III delta' subunit